MEPFGESISHNISQCQKGGPDGECHGRTQFDEDGCLHTSDSSPSNELEETSTTAMDGPEGRGCVASTERATSARRDVPGQDGSMDYSTRYSLLTVR